MSNRLELKGLTEFRQALRNLPEDLSQEAGAIVQAHAEMAKQEIQRAYPEGPTGNLRHGVTVNRTDSRFSSRAIVRSRAQHAWLFEHGVRGPKRSRRVVPEDQKMVPIAIKRRHMMTRALIELVRRAGFQVNGE